MPAVEVGHSVRFKTRLGQNNAGDVELVIEIIDNSDPNEPKVRLSNGAEWWLTDFEFEVIELVPQVRPWQAVRNPIAPDEMLQIDFPPRVDIPPVRQEERRVYHDESEVYTIVYFDNQREKLEVYSSLDRARIEQEVLNMNQVDDYEVLRTIKVTVGHD